MTIVLIVVGVIAALIVGMFALMIFTNLMIIRKTNKLKGEKLPPLPGSFGEKVSKAKRAVLYFFTPTCAACRMLTPRFRESSQKGKPIYLIDISKEIEIARALKILATPTTLEVEEGQIVAVHVGPIPPEELERLTS